MKTVSFTKKLAVGSSMLLVAASSFAADPQALDLTPLTNTFTAAPIVTAILAVCGVLALIYSAARGGKIALGIIRGG